MRSKFRLVLVAIVLLSVAVALPPVASAGTYTVRQCDHAAGNGHHDFQWQASGSPAIAPHGGSGCSEFGLAARNGNGGTEQRYPSGGYGGWFAYAPTGTSITRFSGAFGTLVGCCVNGLATYGDATAGTAQAYLFQGDLGNTSWYAPSGLRGPLGRSWESSTSGFAAKRVGFYLRCGPGFSCYQNPTGDFRVRGRSFDFTLDDAVAPSIADPTGSLLAGGWLRGTRTLSAWAGDVGGGLTGMSASFDNGTTLSSPTACTTVAGRYARLQPCPLGHTGVWSIDTAQLPDGARTVAIRATDAGGTTVGRGEAINVDNTAPAPPSNSEVVGGDGWRATNGFALRWTNPGGQHAPIARARFELCRADGGGCVTGERTAENLTVADPIAVPTGGEWDARVWLEDAAGNTDSSLATPPLRLRFDPDPPALRFAERDPAAPARVMVHASDMSGIAGGTVEMRPFHSRGIWRTLPTARHGSALVADIDDASLRGVFELRARATDLAGNEAAIGGPQWTLPLRNATRLDAAIVKRVRGGRTARRSTVRAAHGSVVSIHGRLVTADGNPLAGRSIAVTSVSRNRTARRASRRTDSAGRFELVLAARRSMAIGLRFHGDRASLPSGHRLRVRVPAPVTMTTRRWLVPAGDLVLFRGRVRGGSLPARGKLVEVQAHFRGRWRTISAVRTALHGRWRFAYRFGSTLRPASYRLRARVPGEARYPFAVGVSRPLRVTVLPR